MSAGSIAVGRVIARVWPLLSLCGAVATLTALVVASNSPTWQAAVTKMLINMTLVVGLYVLVGTSGVFSFGQISFMAVGAYTSGLLTMSVAEKRALLPDLPAVVSDISVPVIPGLLIAVGLAATVALIVGIPLMGLSGIQVGIASLALLLITRTVIGHWNALTNGELGVTGIPLTTTTTSALVCALLAISTAFAFQESRIGLRLRASREDRLAAMASGINIRKDRTIAFMFSAALVALGGALWGHYLGSLSPDDYYLTITFITVVMLVMGGINSLAGAVTGTILVSGLTEVLRRAEGGFSIGALDVQGRPGFQEVVLALLLLVLIVLRPEGITGGKELIWPFGKFHDIRPAVDHPDVSGSSTTDGISKALAGSSREEDTTSTTS